MPGLSQVTGAPLVRLQLRRWKKFQPPREAAPYAGPFAPALSALSDLHVGRMLQRFVERLWETPEISQRGKALVVAVIVRSLGCGEGETESRRLLGRFLNQAPPQNFPPTKP